MTIQLQFITILLTCVYHVTATSEISSVCPFTQLCTNGPLNTTNRGQSCCQPCSCRELCGLVGACCPDRGTQNSTYDLIPCRTQEEIYRRVLNLTSKMDAMSYKFRVVTKCHVYSGTKSLTAITQNDRSRCFSPNSVEDLVFVTGVDSGITYLNKHCAMCNGETEYRKWSLYLTSSQDFDKLSTFEERDKYILDSGDIISFPSQEDDLRLSFCPLFVTNKCNMSGTMDFYNPTLDSKCAQYDNFYYEPSQIRRRVKVYKNVFCFMCNKPRGIQIKHECTDILMNYEFSYSMFQARTSVVPFLALLVPQEKQERLYQKTTREDCNTTEVKDPFQDRCIELLCPPGFVPLQGKCEALFGDVSGFTTEVQFSFPVGQDIDLSMYANLKRLLQELVSHVKKFVNNGRTYCDNCEGTILGPRSDELVLRMKFRSSISCPHFYYIERLSKLFISPFSIFSTTYNTSFQLKGLTEDVFQSFNVKYAFYISLEQFRYCNTDSLYLSTTDFIYCPCIDISEADIQNLDIYQHVKEELFNMSNRISNETLRVCFSDYTKLYNLVSRASSYNAAIFVYHLFMILSVTLSLS